MSSYLNNQNMGSTMPNLPEEEIDLKEIIASLLRYKKSMIGVTLGILLLSIFIALSKTDIYQADLTLQVQDAASQGPGDFMAAALGTQGSNLGNEIAIFKSRFIAKKVLEKVQVGTRYYSTSGFKSVELYKQAPFIVQAYGIGEKLIGYEFQLHPVDTGHFRLSLKPTFGMKVAAFFGSDSTASMIKLTTYQGVFSYGSIITHPLFKLKVIQVGDMGTGSYAFTVTPDEMMYGMIQSSLGITPAADKGSILTLSYQDNVPRRAQDILNAIAEAYEKQNIKIKSASAEKTLGFIDEQLAAVNEGLQKSAINLKDYKSSHVVIELGAKAGLVAGDLSKYEAQMYELDMQQSMLESMLAFIKSNKEIRGIDLSGASEPVISLIQKIQELNTLHSSLLVDYTPKHPSVMKVNDQLASLKSDLQGTLESSLRGLKQRKTSLQEIINKHTSSFEKLPEEERQLTQLNRSFMVNEEIYKFLLQKRAETAIIESSTVSGMRIIDDALINGPAVQPNRALIVMMGLIIGLILGVLQAFIRHFMANTIQTISDLENHTHLPLYSVLPLFKEKKSLYEDALRVLLTRLEFSEEKPKVITITSSVKGEGRTTTALELAQIISKSGKRVVVLDLDMRESRVNKKLAITNELGISNLLSGTNTFTDVVRKVTSHLDVVVAGPIPSNPYELIVSERLTVLLDELRELYDYIILESPPAGLVADALVLMRLSDLNLIVFKAGYSKKDFIKSTNRFVGEHALNNVALILNALELKKIRPWLRK
jgi:capsular exopolysaccharide synthesis family protein